MVPHQAVAVKYRPVPLRSPLKVLQKPFPIPVAFEDVPSLVATGRDMVKRTGILNPQRP